MRDLLICFTVFDCTDIDLHSLEVLNILVRVVRILKVEDHGWLRTLPSPELSVNG
jgi:hypothetical protein